MLRMLLASPQLLMRDKAYSDIRISRLLPFFALLLPLQTFAEVYEVSTTAELREALATAAEDGGDNTIRLAAGTYSTQDDGGGRFEYVSNKSGVLTIVGAGSDHTALDGANSDQVLYVYQEPAIQLTLTVEALTFGNSELGALRITGSKIDAVLTGLIFSDNHNVNYGGALMFQGANLNVEQSQFVRNSSPNRGGAVYLDGANSSEGVVTINQSVFTENFTSGTYGTYPGGGAIHSERGSFGSNRPTDLFENNEFTRNSTAGSGGAILILGPSSISRNTFLNNTATSGASAIGSSRPTLIFGNRFEGHPTGVTAVADQVISNIFIDSGGVRGKQVSNNLLLRSYLIAATDTSVANNIFLENDTDIFKVDGLDAFFLSANNNYFDVESVEEGIRIEGSGNVFDLIELGFGDFLGGDYTLTGSSDLVDAGTTDPELAYITDYDYTGMTARVIGASIDIGPYEYDGEAPPDSDSDGINDNIDNCPSIANEDQADFDSDGAGDACDADDDNDGTNDEDDAFPFDDTESLDTDGDGIGNNEDEDDDGDGTLDDSDPQPNIANVFAIDSDGDGVADSIDDYPTDATKQFSSDGDFDDDGYTNDEEVDYCSNPFDKNSQPDIGGLSLPLIQVLTEQ